MYVAATGDEGIKAMHSGTFGDKVPSSTDTLRKGAETIPGELL